ncbi:hypothetical protein EG878_17515, partial [Enterococcus faecalis]
VGFALGAGAGQGVAAKGGQGGVCHQHGMGGQMQGVGGGFGALSGADEALQIEFGGGLGVFEGGDFVASPDAAQHDAGRLADAVGVATEALDPGG